MLMSTLFSGRSIIYPWVPDQRLETWYNFGIDIWGFIKLFWIEISDESGCFSNPGWASGLKSPDDWGRMLVPKFLLYQKFANIHSKWPLSLYFIKILLIFIPNDRWANNKDLITTPRCLTIPSHGHVSRRVIKSNLMSWLIIIIFVGKLVDWDSIIWDCISFAEGRRCFWRRDSFLEYGHWRKFLRKSDRKLKSKIYRNTSHTEGSYNFLKYTAYQYCSI